jgi:hypothetical protein
VQRVGALTRQTGVRTLKGVNLLVLATLLFGCGTHAAASPAGPSSPVITRVADAEIPLPLATVSGRLSLRHGCLMIGEGVVFWPAGTSWDNAKREVVFGGDFRGSPNAPTDSAFTGGGGLWDLHDDMSGVLDPEAEAALRDCISKTGATHVLLAYPDKP